MGLLSLMQKRGSTYYFRQIVPKDLKTVLGKTEIIHSLDTKDPAKAKQLNKQMALEVEAMFQSVRTGKTVQLGEAQRVLSVMDSLPESNAKTQGIGKKLSDVKEIWAKQKSIPYKTKGAAEKAIERFVIANGELCIGSLESDHLLALKDWLLRQNDLIGSSKRKQITYIKTLVTFAFSNGLLKSNPFAGLNIQFTQADTESRESLSNDDLKRLLLSDAALEEKRTNPEYYWIMLIGLFEGMRLREICQLDTVDVTCERGIYYFDLNRKGEAKKLKNKSSKRKIPIHNTLISLGLIEYAKTLGKGKLFPQLKPYRNDPSHYFSKWFGHYKKRVGIVSTEKVFHSFRHTFKDLCRDCNIPKDASDALTGHASKDVGSTYGDGYSIQNLMNLSNPSPHL